MVELRVQRSSQVFGADFGEARLAVEKWREPVRRGGESLVGKIGPDAFLGPAQKENAVTPLLQALRPRQLGHAQAEHATGQGERARLVGGNARGLLGQNERA